MFPSPMDARHHIGQHNLSSFRYKDEIVQMLMDDSGDLKKDLIFTSTLYTYRVQNPKICKNFSNNVSYLPSDIAVFDLLPWIICAR